MGLKDKTMECINIPGEITFGECRDIRPLSLEERRELMEREKWINNVIRILGMPRWEAENTWVRIQIANHNNSLKA